MQLGRFQGETRAEARGRTRGWMHLATKFVCRLCGTSPRQQVHHIRQQVNTSAAHHLLIPPHVFAACAEPTPDNQYTTFKPTHIHKISFPTCVCRLCGTSSRTDPRPKTTITPHALPLLRNQLPTTLLNTSMFTFHSFLTVCQCTK